MPQIDVEAYEERRQKVKAAVDELDAPLNELVWSIGQRVGERQSYPYIHGVLSGQKRSRPVLDKVEDELEERGAL